MLIGKNDWLEKDFYSVLCVQRNATEVEIKKSYRALARKHHPDANPGDLHAEERFKGIAQAYAVLSNTSERSKYDRVRALGPHSGVRPAGFKRYGETAAAYRPVYKPPLRGKDISARVVLSTKEARRGVTVAVEAIELGRMSRTVFVRIPAGTDDGQQVRVEGRGGYGLNGGKAGDLYVTARVFSAQVLARNPLLNAARGARAGTGLTLGNLPRRARMVAHFLLNPDDVELNQALSSTQDSEWAREIIRGRRQARR